MSALFFSQFRSFCYEAEEDAKKLRQQLTHPSSDCIPNHSYIDELSNLLSSHEKSFRENCENVYSNQLILSEIAPDIFSVYEKNQKMISDLNQHLSKYGCQPLDMQKEGSSNDSQTLDRGQKLQSHEKKMVEEATFSVTDTLSKSSAHDSLSTTPKLDFKKISNATKKVLRQVNQEDQEEKLPRPTTPQLTITKIEHSTPETPPLPDINLTYFQLLQTKANQKRIPMSLLQTPEILTTATHDNIKSCISTPEPDMPNLSCDLTTTVMMKATGEMERIGELLDSQMTPEKSFYRDLEQENDSGDDIDDILNLSNAFSPPKTSKILQPRKNHSQGWIPLVSDAEWFHAPVFLQKQVSVEEINSALIAINVYIEENLLVSDLKHFESLSAEELESIFSKKSFDAPSKVLTMGLVHLKRLDISTENSIKVYKIRRFY